MAKISCGVSERKEENMTVIGGYDFPENCPEGCPGKTEPCGQGGLCHRCPLFNCIPDDEFQLLRPEDYRPDWAKIWKEWFDGGMVGYPILPINKSDEKGDTKT